MQYLLEVQEGINFAKKLYSKSILPGPIKWSCQLKTFKIYFNKQYKWYKTNPISFTCANSKCRKKCPITINSFFEKFSRKKIKTYFRNN